MRSLSGGYGPQVRGFPDRAVYQKVHKNGAAIRPTLGMYDSPLPVWLTGLLESVGAAIVRYMVCEIRMTPGIYEEDTFGREANIATRRDFFVYNVRVRETTSYIYE